MTALKDGKFRFRTIWISDVHLGTRGCQADLLLDFLKHTESDYLYLVGDIIDGWRLKRSWYWHQTHNDVIQKILRKARKGTRVIYVPGNHDEVFRDFTNHRFGRVAMLHETMHVTADGRRLLVLHGDRFDGIVRYAKWLAFVGDSAYTLALRLNFWFNLARRKLGFPYWSLSAYLKHKVKDAVEYISSYEQALVTEARRRRAMGVVCGHIHVAQIRMVDGILYCNDGDWVESCTALVEHANGQLEIVNWATVRGFNPIESKSCESLSSATLGTPKSTASSALSTS
jgi:UDP-2,3-diacylglucosamine pyrophosphatase LpxH